MDHNEHRSLQQAILNQVLLILKNHSHVLGLVLAGSYARGEHDAFSDLDVACYLRDEERTGRQELYERVVEIAPTLWHLWIYDRHALYLFKNGVRLDLDFYKPSDISHPSEVYTNTVIEYDPDCIIVQSSPTQRAPDPRKSTETMVVGVGAFSGTLRGLKRIPSKWRCLVPSTSPHQGATPYPGGA